MQRGNRPLEPPRRAGHALWTRVSARLDARHRLGADTQSAIRGTRWAGLQAITEYLDHYSPAKNADIRTNRVLTSNTLAEKKQHAHQLLAV